MSTDQSTISQAPTNVEKLRGLPWSVAWSVTNSVFAQYTFFGSVFVLFLNQLQLDKSQIGFLLSMLPFLGIIAVFIATPVARLGLKRVFVISFASRTATAVLLLFIPAVMVQFGQAAVLVYVVGAVAIFGLFRAIGLTAYYPWQQERVPDSVRGKFTAISSTLSSLTALLATVAAGLVLGPDPDLSRFQILIAVGVVFGTISVWTSTRLPGGAPVQANPSEDGSFQKIVTTVRDRNFVLYLAGIGLVTLSTAPLASFVPLFMIEEVGLASDQVVWLTTGTLLGGMASSYLWGWLADRYGSKPVMVTGVLFLPLLPLAWLLMPRHVSWSLTIALAIAIGQGLISTGWTIGSGRILFVGIVPPKKRTAYMAVYYAWMGIAGGLGQMFGGWLADLGSKVQGQVSIIRFDTYTLLFAVGIIFPLVAHLVLRQVKADSPVTVKQFAGMFLRGNPLVALTSLIGFHRARDERATVAMTERLGSTKSPLTVEELLEALHDPRFYVRFEAIVAIARHGPEPRLIEALIKILEGNVPSLSTVAAWALGRIGDEQAMAALRQGLNADYRSVQAHCARSLGSLDDRTVLPILADRLETETDIGLQLAYASALGKLGATEAAPKLLSLLRAADSADTRLEYTLALARLIGEEHRFIQLRRKAESEPGTTFSQAVTALKGKLLKSHQSNPEVEAALDAAAQMLAQDDLAQGVDLLCSALKALPGGNIGKACEIVARDSIAGMEEFGSQRSEYIILALHAVDCGLDKEAQSWLSR